LYYIHLRAYEDYENIYSPKYNEKIKELLEDIGRMSVSFVFIGEFIVKPWDLQSIEEYLKEKEREYGCDKSSCNKLREELSQ
jgi:hypothetical protein